MEENQIWRPLLGKIISEPHERQRIADIIAVNAVTLVRWANGKSNPRPDNLRPLLDAVPPQYRQELAELITLAYPQFFSTIPAEAVEVPATIPSTFYAQVLQTYTTCPQILRMSMIETLILRQLESQLDPFEHGIIISIAQLVPPVPGQKVRSMRITFYHSTMPVRQLMEHQTLFLGAESQVGYALNAGHPSITQSNEDMIRMFPIHNFIWEKSAAAYPIILSNRAAGCLYIASPRTNYFTQPYQDLINNYVDLLALSYEDCDFYDLEQIELGIMPRQSVQEPFISKMQKHVKNMMIVAAHEERPITSIQAERIVLQKIEEELLLLAFDTKYE